MKHYLPDLLASAVGLALFLGSAYVAYSLGYSEGAHHEHSQAVLREAAMLDRDACTRERQQIDAWCREELATQRAMFSRVMEADAAQRRGRR